MDEVIALDIGGTKIEAGIVDATGAVVSRARAATATGAGAEAIFDQAIHLLNEVTVGRQPAACGVGCGGPMSRDGEAVSPVNIADWRSFPLRGRLADSLGLPVFVDNDAKALARAEGWVGSAIGVGSYLAMVVSTGVGGGIVLDGRLLHGASGNAGHVGHVIVEADGRTCGCGAQGCLEAEASGTAIESSTGAPAREASDEVRVRTGRLVGRAVGSVANLLDLRLAVVAGSVALGFGRPFFDAAQRELDAVCKIAHSAGALVRPSDLGSDGPLIGAAAVGFSGLGVEAGPR